MLNYFTGACQIFMHRFEMTKQVARKIFKYLVVAWFIGFVYYLATTVPLRSWYEFSAYWIARIKTHEKITADPDAVTQSYYSPYGEFVTEYSLDIIVDPRISRHAKAVNLHISNTLSTSFNICLLIIFLLFISGSIKGWSQRRIKHIRGRKLRNVRQGKMYLKLRCKASKLKIGGMPIVKNTETEHFMLVGVTGSGKTTITFDFLDYARANNQKVIIIDTSDTYRKKYARKGDVILNVADPDCASWSMWNEIFEEAHYEEIVNAALKDDGKANDPFWIKASRVVVAELLRELKRQGRDTNKELARHLFYDRVPELKELLKNTCAARFTEEEAEKMSYGVLANFIAPLQFLRYLPDKNEQFSIRRWMQNQKDDSWLFLTANKDHLALMLPMLSMWFDISKSSLLALDRDLNRRVWFIADELPSLGPLEGLNTFMMEARQRGGSFVGGIQTLASLRRLYGPDGSVEIISNMNNKVLLRTGDPESAKFISELIGKEEIIEPQEQISIGAHEVRGSTTFTRVRSERTLVTESEMMDLKKLNGYLILADKCPVIRIKYDIVKNIDSIVPKFIKDALSHDKYAQDLINKHEPEFKATEFYQQYCSAGSEGQLIIHDNTVSANEDKIIIENDVKDSSDFIMSDLFSQGDKPIATDEEVLGERKASTFEVLDDGVVLTLDDNSELRVKQKNLGTDDIKKSNLKLANGGTVLMVDGQINNIDELICSNDINYATISSVKVVGDDLLLGLSNNDLFSVDIDTLELPKSAEKKPKTSSCKKILIWGKKEMSLEETIKIGRLIDG